MLGATGATQTGTKHGRNSWEGNAQAVLQSLPVCEPQRLPVQVHQEEARLCSGPSAHAAMPSEAAAVMGTLALEVCGVACYLFQSIFLRVTFGRGSPASTLVLRGETILVLVP